MKIIFKSKVGSHLFGTNTSNSDTDYYSVYVPSRDEILTGEYPPFIKDDTSGDYRKNTKHDVDHTMNSIKEYLRLLKMGDIHAIEMLFVRKDQAEIWTSEWEILHENRMCLTDPKISRFRGFIANRIKYLEKSPNVNEKDLYHLYRICSESVDLVLTGDMKFPLHDYDIKAIQYIREGKSNKKDVIDFSKYILKRLDDTVREPSRDYFETLNEMTRLYLLYIHMLEVENVKC